MANNCELDLQVIIQHSQHAIKQLYIPIYLNFPIHLTQTTILHIKGLKIFHDRSLKVS